MTLAVRNDTSTALDVAQPASNQQIAQLAEWAQAASAALDVAKGLVTTSFVPKAYQGKPMEATAAILAGAEVGLSPMASLRAFDNIQGTPAPKAITLRAIVQAQGHEVRIEQSDDTVAVVAARRRGDTEWQRSTWTIERARKMGLASKDQWKAQPAAMLIARATAEVCRWIAADAIMGMPYTAEEIRDDGAFDTLEHPESKRVTAEEILNSLDPDLAEVAAEAGEAAPTAEAPVTDRQRKHMFALWRALGYDGETNRDMRLTITAKILGVAKVGSSSLLTADQADRVIAALEERKASLPTVGQDDDVVELPSDGE